MQTRGGFLGGTRKRVGTSLLLAHGDAHAIGGDHNHVRTLLDEIANCRDINAFPIDARRSGGAEWSDSFAGLTEECLVVGSRSTGLLSGKQHDATTDKGARKNIQPDEKARHGQTTNDKTGNHSSRRAVFIEDKNNRSNETKQTDRSDDETGQKDLGGEQQKAGDEEGDDEGRSVHQWIQLRGVPCGAGRPMKNALMLSPTRTAVLVVVCQAFSPQRLE